MNKYPSPNPRRAEIARLVRDAGVRSQAELMRLLRRRGFHVAQPTLSRDLRELGVAKTPAGYVLPGDLPEMSPAGVSTVPARSRDQRMIEAVREFVISVDAAGSLVVLKTPPADAQPVARAIDEAGLPGAVGTLGGDDTIFVAALNAEAARRLAERFGALMRSPHRPRRPRR